ncbi:Leucine--tRNA ligase, partial [Clarias magur]
GDGGNCSAVPLPCVDLPLLLRSPLVGQIALAFRLELAFRRCLLGVPPLPDPWHW